MILTIHLDYYYYKTKVLRFWYTNRQFFTRDFYKKKNHLSIVASDFDFWFNKKFICRKKHKFEYWNLIQNYKCGRCLEPDYERNDANLNSKIVERQNYYEKLQIPWWKLSGQKPKPQDIALDKYLKTMGLTYGEWKKKRDYYMATNPSAVTEWEQAINNNSLQNAPKYKKN